MVTRQGVTRCFEVSRFATRGEAPGVSRESFPPETQQRQAEPFGSPRRQPVGVFPPRTWTTPREKVSGGSLRPAYAGGFFSVRAALAWLRAGGLSRLTPGASVPAHENAQLQRRQSVGHPRGIRWEHLEAKSGPVTARITPVLSHVRVNDLVMTEHKATPMIGVGFRAPARKVQSSIYTACGRPSMSGLFHDLGSWPFITTP